MRKGGGKAKGSQFEREVCRKLSLWISKGQHEDVFWRSAMSGGRSTIAHRKGKRLAAQAGDISSIHPIGHAFAKQFLIECKSYKDLQYHGLLTGKGNLLTFWAQTWEQAYKYRKLPMLVAKQNQLPAHVCLDGVGITTLGLETHVAVPRLNLYIVMLATFLEEACIIP